MPPPARIAASRSTRRSTAACDAPSAMRMPISAVRRLTAYDIDGVEPDHGEREAEHAERAEQRGADAARHEGERQRRSHRLDVDRRGRIHLRQHLLHVAHGRRPDRPASARARARTGRGCRAAGTIRRRRPADPRRSSGACCFPRRRRFRPGTTSRIPAASDAVRRDRLADKYRRTNSSLTMATTGAPVRSRGAELAPRATRDAHRREVVGPDEVHLVAGVERLAPVRRSAARRRSSSRCGS